MSHAEQVLCIQEAFTHKYMQERSFVAFSEVEDFHTFTMYFKDRSEAEINEHYKQIIPYLLIKSGCKYFVYNRGQCGGEQRLNGKFSVGIGGHVNDEDLTLLNNVCRELFEELGKDVYNNYFRDNLCDYTGQQFVQTCKGFIYDNTTAVGLAHLGLLFELKVNHEFTPGGEIQEYNQWNRWITKEEIKSINDPDNIHERHMIEFEDWSKIAIEEFICKGYDNEL